jgi:RES domain-containing protein
MEWARPVRHLRDGALRDRARREGRPTEQRADSPDPCFTRITIPAEASVEAIETTDLPGWDADDRAASRAFGNAWYDEQRSLVLIVPSLAAPGLERNVLINQRHPDFRRVKHSDPAPVVCHPNLLVP